jgi:uncharacterized protein
MIMQPIKSIPTLALLQVRRAEILALAAHYGASQVRVFGSVARDEATPNSDIDLLVSFRAGVSLLDMIALQQDLEDLLGRSVDVVDDRAIKARFHADISQDARPL